MKQLTLHRSLTALGIATLAVMTVKPAVAACVADGGGKPQPILRPVSFGALSEQDRDENRDDSEHATVVGFWHVRFIAKNSPGIPDGTELDAGYQLWHSDGTEVLFSALRKPMDGNVCFGVWKKAGPRQYKLNHFAAPWDVGQTQLIGPANFLIEVTLDRSGEKFAGPFAVNSYDESGNLLSQVRGTITGTRIEVETPPERIQ